MGLEAINNVARTAYSVDIPPLSKMAVMATIISPSPDGASVILKATNYGKR